MVCRFRLMVNIIILLIFIGVLLIILSLFNMYIHGESIDLTSNFVLGLFSLVYPVLYLDLLNRIPFDCNTDIEDSD